MGLKSKILLGAAIAAAALTASAGELKLMSYNVRGGMGLDELRDPQRTARVISAQRPDIVAVQELDSMTNRCGRTYVLGQLGEATGMKGYFAPAIDYDGGKYGIGILCREEPLSVTRRSLPGREEARAIIVAEFSDYIFAATHLSLTEEDRLASVDIIKSIARESGKPFFFAGDLNSHPADKVITSLTDDFDILSPTDVCTYPADEPAETIDYIMLRKGAGPVKILSSEVIEASIESDHRPIAVKICLPK